MPVYKIKIKSLYTLFFKTFFVRVALVGLLYILFDCLDDYAEQKLWLVVGLFYMMELLRRLMKYMNFWLQITEFKGHTSWRKVCIFIVLLIVPAEICFLIFSEKKNDMEVIAFMQYPQERLTEDFSIFPIPIVFSLVSWFSNNYKLEEIDRKEE